MENIIYNTDESKLSYGRGYVYSLQYHIVWCTKYRREVLTAGADEYCKKLLSELAGKYSFRILAVEVMPDHIHILIDAKPQFYISDMVKIMKGSLARRLFLRYPEIKKKLWGGHLWNPSYCVVTVSDRSREQVEQYIESQKEKAWGGKGRPPRDLERLQRYHREILGAGHGRSDGEASETSQLSEDHISGS